MYKHIKQTVRKKYFFQFRVWTCVHFTIFNIERSLVAYAVNFSKARTELVRCEYADTCDDLGSNVITTSPKLRPTINNNFTLPYCSRFTGLQKICRWTSWKDWKPLFLFSISVSVWPLIHLVSEAGSQKTRSTRIIT